MPFSSIQQPHCPTANCYKADNTCTWRSREQSRGIAVKGVAQLLAVTGELLWSGAYAWAFFIGQRAHVPAFPIPAIWLNLTWEVMFALLRPPRDRVTAFVYRSWLVLDLCLFAQLYWLQAPPELASISRGWYIAIVSCGGMSIFWLQQALSNWLRDSHVQAYLINLFVSVLFVCMFVARTDGAGLSLGVAWLKLLGTLAISLANVLAWYRSKRFRFVGILLVATVTGVDLAYVLLLQRFERF